MAHQDAANATANARIARLEKAAITYLDSFIDSRALKHGVNFLVPLVSFQGHVGVGDDRIRTYIGRKKMEVEDFITNRTHLWKVRAASSGDDVAKILVVEKQPIELRSVFVRVLNYVQRKTRETGSGAKLNNISVLIGQYFPTIKKCLGSGLTSVKTFLSEYPTLFTIVPDLRLLDHAEETNIGEILFKNRASLVDDVILLTTNTAEFRNLTRFGGCGPVVRIFPTFGFIRDDNTKKDAHFTFDAVQGIEEESFRRQVNEGKRFNFEAVISREYDAGNTKNKWSVTRLFKDETCLKIVPSLKPISNSRDKDLGIDPIVGHLLARQSQPMTSNDSTSADDTNLAKEKTTAKQVPKKKAKVKKTTPKQIGQEAGTSPAGQVQAVSVSTTVISGSNTSRALMLVEKVAKRLLMSEEGNGQQSTSGSKKLKIYTDEELEKKEVKNAESATQTEAIQNKESECQTVSTEIITIDEGESVGVQTEMDAEEKACEHCGQSTKNKINNVLIIVDQLSKSVDLMQKALNDVKAYLNQ